MTVEETCIDRLSLTIIYSDSIFLNEILFYRYQKDGEKKRDNEYHAVIMFTIIIISEPQKTDFTIFVFREILIFRNSIILYEHCI